MILEWLKSDRSNHARLLFKVMDSGIGIPTDKLQDIFKGFMQSTQSITRKFGGTGLGLTISKRLVELQDGKIELEILSG